MGMNQTPMAERVHIGFFGRRNAGKSSVMNAVTGQELAVVSDVKGTTTDPVYKSMELLPLGPVVMMDTPGIDDEGDLGTLRVKKSYQVLNKTDAAVLVIDAVLGAAKEDEALIRRIREKQIPYLVVLNKADLVCTKPRPEEKGSTGEDEESAAAGMVKEAAPETGKSAGTTAGGTQAAGKAEESARAAGEAGTQAAGAVSEAVPDTGESGENAAVGMQLTGTDTDIREICRETAAALSVPADKVVAVSASEKTGIEELKKMLASLAKTPESKLRIVGDLIHPSDFVVLVVPIDKAAPKGRLILPQQQTIRDILEADAVSIVVKEYELRETLASLGKKPRMVITDSQVFAKVSADTPRDILLTSFSILFARYKGNLETVVRGVTALENIQDGDTILISEGCTHHRQCDDIGTVKLPRWIRRYTQKDVRIETTSGTEFPDDLSPYALVVHCGACMLNEREMKYRLRCAGDQGVPITNYGILIAYMQGILKRSVEAFPEIAMLL